MPHSVRNTNGALPPREGLRGGVGLRAWAGNAREDGGSDAGLPPFMAAMPSFRGAELAFMHTLLTFADPMLWHVWARFLARNADVYGCNAVRFWTQALHLLLEILR